MIQITNPVDCCGCTACASICNHEAITMKPDALGFLYPEVDTEKCTNCGLCEKVCSFNDNYDTSLNFKEPIAYGARHKDIDEVMKSRSGAVFVALSDYVLDNGGIVYGAGYTDHFRVIHKRAVTKEERDEFRGSKYVQSDMTTVFGQVKNDLKNGLTVLFSGTPCQTSGLNSYVGKGLRDRLILVDIVCHGVPSPFIWRDYLNYIEKTENTTIYIVNFRDKEQYGWSAHYETLKNGLNKIINKTAWYSKMFQQNIMFRQSCGNCHFCNTIRPSDITIADFWGWKKTDSVINKDERGLNLVLVNTKKGIDLFGSITEKLDVFDVTPDSYMQPNLQHPSVIHRKRMQFEKDYKKYGFEYVYKHKYYPYPLWKMIFLKLKKIS